MLKRELVRQDRIERAVLRLRGCSVMLDEDLAALYGVDVKALNQAVKRNRERFPPDFMFLMSPEEARSLRSQFVTAKPGRGGRRTLPYAFTEQGVAMLSSVLRSNRAVQANIQVMRAFVKLRQLLTTNVELARKLNRLEHKYDSQFHVVFQAIRELMAPKRGARKRIGFVLPQNSRMRHVINGCVFVALAAAGTVAQQRGRGPDAAREVSVATIPGVVAAGAAWTLAWQGTDNADGIVGTEDGGLLFAQEQPNQISKLDRADRVSVFLRDTHGAGALSIDSRGRIIAAERTCTDPGRSAAAGLCTEPTAIAVLAPERKTLADNVDGRSLGRLNDLVAGSNGGVYFTSGGAFHLDAAGRVTSLGDNLRANGVMLNRDERVVYVTNGNTILAFDIQPDGTTANRRDFGTLDAGGSGDGMAIDAEGRLYVTTNPGVQVLSAGGAFLGLIPTPRGVISVAFAGPGKKTLYVVGSGALGPDGREFTTPQGVRNNAKTIYRIPMLAEGFKGRAK